MYRKNKLLAALENNESQVLIPDLELIYMHLGTVLFEAGDLIKYVYFPISSVVTLIYDTESGSSTGVAVIGNDGLVGSSLFMSGESSTFRAVVHNAGYGFRVKAVVLMEEFNRYGVLMHLFLRYTQTLMTQMVQTAVCNRYHSISQQLCRWILLNVDSLQSNELKMTQALIASALGVRRESISEEAYKLQSEGLISYSRGHISICNREGLEHHACECYSVVKNEYNRLLPPPLSHDRLHPSIYGIKILEKADIVFRPNISSYNLLPKSKVV